MAETAADRIGAEAGAVEVEDLAGRRVRLDSLWKAQPVVLVLLRHFG